MTSSSIYFGHSFSWIPWCHHNSCYRSSTRLACWQNSCAWPIWQNFWGVRANILVNFRSLLVWYPQLMHNVIVKRSVLETVKHLFHPRHQIIIVRKYCIPNGSVAFSVLVIVGIVGVPFLKVSPANLVLFWAMHRDITTDQVLVLTNQQRAQSGLAALAISNQLSSAASAKAADMFQNQYWAHVSPSGKEPWDFISASGYSYRVAGENLARDFNHTGDMVQAWMDSPTHRANIMNGRYTETGLAVVNGSVAGCRNHFGGPNVWCASSSCTTAGTGSTPPSRGSTSSTNRDARSSRADCTGGICCCGGCGTKSHCRCICCKGEVQLTKPRTTVLARETFPKGTLQPFNHIDPLSIIKSFLISILIVLLGTLVYDLCHWPLSFTANCW